MRPLIISPVFVSTSDDTPAVTPMRCLSIITLANSLPIWDAGMTLPSASPTSFTQSSGLSEGFAVPYRRNFHAMRRHYSRTRPG